MSTTAQKLAVTNHRKRVVEQGGSLISSLMLTREATQALAELQVSLKLSRTKIIEKLILKEFNND